MLYYRFLEFCWNFAAAQKSPTHQSQFGSILLNEKNLFLGSNPEDIKKQSFRFLSNTSPLEIRQEVFWDRPLFLEDGGIRFTRLGLSGSTGRANDLTAEECDFDTDSTDREFNTKVYQGSHVDSSKVPRRDLVFFSVLCLIVGFIACCLCRF